MKKALVLFFLLVIAFLGLDYEFGNMADLGLSTHDYQQVFSAILLLLIYVLPLLYLLHMAAKRWEIPMILFPFIILFGGFSSGWIATFGNEAVGSGLTALFGHSALLKQWSDALSAPFVEEFSKGLFALCFLYLLKIEKPQGALLTGMGVGLGFQLIEDIAYISDAAEKSLREVIPEALNRVSGSVSSHWVYTGIFTLGLFYLIKHVKGQRAYLWLLAPIILHFLWNSPWNNTFWLGPVLNALTILLLVYLFLKLDGESEIVKE
ncbi:PrsW family glutamic-type intramembrane protease [Candidatus Enterococcus ferrettii]|uniref:PrsW family intramembrane metalloprotease n=1 Tax=Candidatus Enterococcus ferrettii TaxID=2815324 RepID=A0ABV0ESB4_9ENTE|nr:PrsW family glutamic-type intramembrane protease [Enterococcus sp. 665A]MBO1340589.1 PrsW family intramembrane metalloprotease [Enterococcus sp. 665A]